MNYFYGCMYFNNKVYTADELNKLYTNIENNGRNLFPETSKVMLIVEKCPEMICAMWYFFNNNIVFVPIDISTPEKRVQYIYNQLLPDYVIVDNRDIVPYDVDLSKIIDMHTLTKENEVSSSLHMSLTTNPLSYIIYTSGTTGNPKGVMIKKSSVMNLIKAMQCQLNMQRGQVMLTTAVVSFDMFIAESLVPVALGLDLIIASREEQNNPKALGSLLLKYEPDFIQMTPSKLAMVFKANNINNLFSKQTNILLGGEMIIPELVERLKSLDKVVLFNMYGPTEATVWATCSCLNDHLGYDIGFPLLNMNIYILNEERKEVNVGGMGEIAIGGAGIAQGYYKMEELTDERFVFYNKDRVYLTGDIGKIDENGRLIYCGRMDNQVKVKGYRIELEEIENVCLKFCEMEHAVCIQVKLGDTSKLILFYQSVREMNSAFIIEKIKDILPEYMLPDEYIWLNEIPTNLNNKVDRKKISEFYLEKYEKKLEKEKLSINGSDFEKCMWQIILDNINDFSLSNKFRKDLTFQDLRIDSLEFTNIILDIEERFGIQFDLEHYVYSAFNDLNDLFLYVQLLCK